LKTLKDALSGGDIDAIRRATETLATGVQELGKRLYEQSAAATGTDGGSAGPAGGHTGASHSPNDDEVVDAEIVDEHGHGHGA
jgi:molecular chaperone DnaK